MVKTKTIVMVVVLSFLALIFMFIVGIATVVFSGAEMGNGNIAIISVDGVIIAGNSESFLGPGIASSTDIVELIDQAADNPQVDAILIEINSPGGSAVASDEIGQAIKKANKTTVAWIREVGASGGYWVASACDVIVANRMTITGSIGVISSYLEFSGLLDDYNVTYQRLVAGKYKDIGTPFRELTEEETEILQSELDLIHDFFIQEVAQNRDMSEKEIREIADGLFFTGYEAHQMGLVDILGGRDEAVLYIEEKLGIEAELVRYEMEASLFDILAGVFYKGSFFTGQGFASEIMRPRFNGITLR